MPDVIGTAVLRQVEVTDVDQATETFTVRSTYYITGEQYVGDISVSNTDMDSTTITDFFAGGASAAAVLAGYDNP